MNNDTKEYIDKIMNRYNFMSDRGSIEVGDETHIFTGTNIIKGMYDLLEDGFWRNADSTILDISCKSSGFLVEAYCRFMVGLEKEIPNVRERHANILINQLWGITPCQVLGYTSRRILYNRWDLEGNVFEISDYKELGRKGEIALLSEIEERSLREMKFDVVVGNPPYNRGMDIDFINLGFEICSKYCLMITPAKWQTADDNQRIASKMSYGEFREKIVPHMKQIVFYPDCKDIFDIYQTDGITYYIIDKQNKHEKTIIENISKTRGNIIDSIEVRDIKNRQSLLNIGNEIIESLEPYKKFKFSGISGGKQYSVYTNTKVSGYDWYVQNEARYVISISRIVNSGAGETYGGESKIIFESNDRNECESFISWINSRFTRFFLIPNISKLNGILTDHCFRFVPAPPPSASGNPWDHIYTDEELYKHFKLPQKYIEVIESLIKERK